MHALVLLSRLPLVTHGGAAGRQDASGAGEEVRVVHFRRLSVSEPKASCTRRCRRRGVSLNILSARNAPQHTRLLSHTSPFSRPAHRFPTGAVKEIIRTVLTEKLTGTKYSQDASPEHSQKIADEIKRRCKCTWVGARAVGPRA